MEGKAKEALSKFQDSKDNLDRMINNNKMLLNSLTIEWLDSVGIHITVSYWIVTNKWQDIILGFYNGNFEHETRQEATEAAIKKAVEIYNEKYDINEHSNTNG